MGTLIAQVFGPSGAAWALTQLLITGVGGAILKFLLGSFPGTKKYAFYIEYGCGIVAVSIVAKEILKFFGVVGKLLGV
jgi:hypothetical protein